MRTIAATIVIVLGIALGIVTTSAQSCTTSNCTAASTSEADVLAALPSSGNANATVVVTIPAGNSTWTTNANYTVPSAVTNLTIQGQSTVSCTGTAGTSGYACSATDNTIIVDSSPPGSCCTPLLNISTGATSSYFRLTGITIRGTSSSNLKYTGIIEFWGSSHSLRIDHNHFDAITDGETNGTMVQLYGPMEGVADHNLFDLYTNNTYGSVTSGIRTGNDLNDTIGDGDGAWASPSNWGSSAFFFEESNVFNGGVSNDCENSGWYVARYNTYNDMALPVQNHATKSDVEPQRGCREEEIYHNYWSGPGGSPEDTAISLKGGPSLIWGNNVASGYNHLLVAETDRNGITRDERATPGGWGTCWNGAAGAPGGANGPTAWDGNSDTYGYPCLDGIGRGQTVQSLNGQGQPNRLNSSTGTIAWPQQYLEPIYAFDNSGTLGYYTLDHVTHLNRDVYLDNASFNGTTGTGTGLLSARPATCTAGPGGTYGASPTGSYGVAYWATDANSGNGELYVCTATNTWTGIYQPYTYPHPLVTGGNVGSSSDAPVPPAGLSAIVQ